MSAMHYQRDSFPADAEQIHAAREQLRRWLRAAGIHEPTVQSVVIAASEALDNAAAHAYRPHSGHDKHLAHCSRRDQVVELTMLVDHSEILVTVTDFGDWRDPGTTVLEHDTIAHPAVHGRGIILMNAHVDEVAVHHDTHGTSVLLRHSR